MKAAPTADRIVLINTGFGNMAVASKIVAILVPSSAPIKRIKESARNAQKLIDATQGRRTRSIIIMESGHIILSAVQHETMAQRIERSQSKPLKKKAQPKTSD